MTREEAEKISAELMAKGMAEADAYEAAARAMLAALKHADSYLRPACEDGRYEARKTSDVIRAAIVQAEAAGIRAD